MATALLTVIGLFVLYFWVTGWWFAGLIVWLGLVFSFAPGSLPNPLSWWVGITLFAFAPTLIKTTAVNSQKKALPKP